MRKPLRIALVELRRAGLRVTGIRHGGKHCEIQLADGRIVRLSKGTRIGSGFANVMRDHARRLQGGARP